MLVLVKGLRTILIYQLLHHFKHFKKFWLWLGVQSVWLSPRTWRGWSYYSNLLRNCQRLDNLFLYNFNKRFLWFWRINNFNMCFLFYFTTFFLNYFISNCIFQILKNLGSLSFNFFNCLYDVHIFLQKSFLFYQNLFILVIWIIGFVSLHIINKFLFITLSCWLMFYTNRYTILI